MQKYLTAVNYGTLYVVATPIGNIDDISLRAIKTLQEVDTIIAEDTRHSLSLLNTLAIKKSLVSLHAHNEEDKSEQFINQLKAGKSLALISDAGTPLISDPGFILVKRAQELGIQVAPIPGACALITALSVAGVPCDNFFFAGFLPAKQLARIIKLKSLYALHCTVIIYESTHRIIDCIEDIITICGSHYQFALAKELTKIYECIIHASATDIKEWLSAETGRSKGEFVLILPALPELDDANTTANQQLLSILMGELPLKQAVKIAALITNTAKNNLYGLALSMRN